jgi:hypothetical protein
MILLFYTSHCHWMTGVHHDTQLLPVGMGSHELFLPELTWNLVFRSQIPAVAWDDRHLAR